MTETLTTCRATRDHHGVVTITLARPDKRNALSSRMVRELHELLDWTTPGPACAP